MTYHIYKWQWMFAWFSDWNAHTCDELMMMQGDNVFCVRESHTNRTSTNFQHSDSVLPINTFKIWILFITHIKREEEVIWEREREREEKEKRIKWLTNRIELIISKKTNFWWNKIILNQKKKRFLSCSFFWKNNLSADTIHSIRKCSTRWHLKWKMATVKVGINVCLTKEWANESSIHC